MGPWDDGRRAWERLDGWDQDGPVPGHPDDGDGALGALSDIGTVRRLLDQAELAAVRTARRHGKSWAEIATRLGVTRQSAWERWRDLDEPAAEPVAEVVELPASEPDYLFSDYSHGESDDPADIAAGELVGRAQSRRRRSSVVVPDVLGLSWERAEARLSAVGLVATGDERVGWVVDQTPEAGARVPAGSPVRLWVGSGGGGSGVREPRRPKPRPRSGRELPPEHREETTTSGG
jgi:transcriptional regulator with XRE-family HTH domain